MHPSDLKYHKEHEWVRVEGDTAVIGISHFAQDQLGEVVYVDMPDSGDAVTADETFGEIESVKSVSELFAPVSGEIIEVNESLGDTPETVNAEPHEGGWMIKINLSARDELDALLSAEEYDTFVSEG